MARNAISMAPLAAAQAHLAGEGYWQIAWRRLRKHHLAMGGLLLIFLLILTAIFAPWVAPYKFEEIDLMNRFARPFQGGHLLGTDDLGHDVFTRLEFEFFHTVRDRKRLRRFLKYRLPMPVLRYRSRLKASSSERDAS